MAKEVKTDSRTRVFPPAGQFATSKGKYGKAALCALLGIMLALALFSQAMSGVLTRNSPSLALSFLSANGEARDRHAFAVFTNKSSAVTDIAELQNSAQNALPIARQALAMEPLLPRSLAIIAMAEADRDEKARILSIAENINRRSTPLQSVRLAFKAAEGDYEAVFATVDRILRVNPGVGDQLYPNLILALQEERGAENLRQLAASGSPWIEKFLLTAVASGSVTRELVQFRQQTDLQYPTFDKLLLLQLTREGAYFDANRLYHALRVRNDPAGKSELLDWRFDYPPFDWMLEERPGFRAQPARGSEGIEIDVRPGEAGVLVTRIIAAPNGASEIWVRHNFPSSKQLQYFRFRVRCADSSLVLADKPLTQSTTIIELPAVKSCNFLKLDIDARVFSGRPAVSGAIEDIKLIER